MARKGGFERQGGSVGRVKFDYGDTFAREVLNAKKKAGRIIGRKVVKDRLEALTAERQERRAASGITPQRKTGLSRRRRQAVRSLVGRDGTLVVFDHAPMAVIQETGGIIRPTSGKFLKIQNPYVKATPGRKTFVTKKGLVFEVAPHKKRKRNKDGTFSKSRTVKPKPKLIATLKTEVVVPKLPEKRTLEGLGKNRLSEFRDLFSQYLIEGI